MAVHPLYIFNYKAIKWTRRRNRTLNCNAEQMLKEGTALLVLKEGLTDREKVIKFLCQIKRIFCLNLPSYKVLDHLNLPGHFHLAQRGMLGAIWSFFLVYNQHQFLQSMKRSFFLALLPLWIVFTIIPLSQPLLFLFRLLGLSYITLFLTN